MQWPSTEKWRPLTLNVFFNSNIKSGVKYIARYCSISRVKSNVPIYLMMSFYSAQTSSFTNMVWLKIGQGWLIVSTASWVCNYSYLSWLQRRLNLIVVFNLAVCQIIIYISVWNFCRSYCTANSSLVVVKCVPCVEQAVVVPIHPRYIISWLRICTFVNLF